MTKPGLAEIVLVVDRSGSMSVSREEVLQGLNTFVSDQQNFRGEAHFSLLLFNETVDWRTHRARLETVPVYRPDDYRPYGMTALQDALAYAIRQIGQDLAALPEEERPSQVLVATLTDGWENASQDYRGLPGLERLRNLIHEQEQVYQWEFLFLAQNLDAVQAAQNLGIASNVGVTLDPGPMGTRAAFSTSSNWATNKRKKL